MNLNYDKIQMIFLSKTPGIQPNQVSESGQKKV